MIGDTSLSFLITGRLQKMQQVLYCCTRRVSSPHGLHGTEMGVPIQVGINFKIIEHDYDHDHDEDDEHIIVVRNGGCLRRTRGEGQFGGKREKHTRQKASVFYNCSIAT